MVPARSDDAAGFTDAEIVGNVLGLLLAGEDTTANTLAWIMHLISEYPQVQANMQAEADRVLGGGERLADYEAAKSLRYIEAVAHEAMRLLPVSPLQGAQPVAAAKPRAGIRPPIATGQSSRWLAIVAISLRAGRR